MAEALDFTRSLLWELGDPAECPAKIKQLPDGRVFEKVLYASTAGNTPVAWYVWLHRITGEVVKQEDRL